MKLTTKDINYSQLHFFLKFLRTLTKRKDDCCDIENVIFARPKYRRSIGPALVTTFLNLCRGVAVRDVFEIGVMDGRHTRLLLKSGDWSVHSFEPNIHCIPALLPLTAEPRFRLVPFAVSNTTGFAELSIPLKFLGKDIGAMSGVSTLARHLDADANSYQLQPQIVATMCGRDYISRFAHVDPTSVALWVDTEGSGLEVLSGCREYLSQFPVVILEVEYGAHFSSSPNWNAVVKLLLESNHKIIGRDWQQEGQCNILSVRSDLMQHPCFDKATRDYFELMALCAEL
jgi:FkbM family methyltransferase